MEPNSQQPNTQPEPIGPDNTGGQQASTTGPMPAIPQAAQQTIASNPSLLRSKQFAAIAGVLGLLLLSALGYLFIYLPNTPENVYRRGMASVGVGLEEIVESSFDSENTSTEYSGQMELTIGGEKISAEMDGMIGASGASSLNFMINNLLGQNLSLESVGEPLSGEEGNTFFRLQGFESAFAQLGYNPDVNAAIDGQWWSISASSVEDFYSDQLGVTLSLSENETLSQAEYEELLKAIIASLNEYVFTSDTEKMVVEMEEYLDDEEYEGVDSKKYRAGINRENLKSHLKDARDRLNATSAIDKLQKIDATDTEIDNEVDDIDFEQNEYYVWVDSDTKVMRNLRITDKDNVDSNYVDLSLLLEDGNDALPMRVKFAIGENNSDFVLSMTTRLEDEADSITISIEGSESTGEFFGAAWELSGNMQLKGISEEPALQYPTDSSPLDLGSFFGGSGTGSVGSGISDTESKTDITSLHTQLEVFYNDNGYYPSEVSPITLPDAPSDTFYDATSYPILSFDSPTSTPEVQGFSAGDYVYYASNCTADQCQTYVLEATLSDGQRYTKNSLN
ncbi:MAG: DUF1720 domain-containing protein [Patescibacteria group bacterium]